MSAEDLPPAAADLERMFPSDAPSPAESEADHRREKSIDELPRKLGRAATVGDDHHATSRQNHPCGPRICRQRAEALAEIFPEEKPEAEEPVPEDVSEAPSEDVDVVQLKRGQESTTGRETDHAKATSAARKPRAHTRKRSEKRAESRELRLKPRWRLRLSAAVFWLRERSYSDWAFEEKLASHREWVESRGNVGKQASPRGSAKLEGMELIGVNLRLADLHDVNLKGADLLLADLRDSCLVRADLDDACLVGTNLEGANLEGASLESAPWDWCHGNSRARTCATLRCQSRYGNSMRRWSSGELRPQLHDISWPSRRAAWFRGC